MSKRYALWGAFALTMTFAGPVAAQNQTPTTSPISLNDAALPYTVHLERVDVPRTLPTLQSFALGQHDGLWVLIGGRTNGLHNFTNLPLKNFPPADQNRKIWVIDPTTWKSWSRVLSDSDLSVEKQDALAATAQESVQVGDTLYVVGGYGYSDNQKNFVTFPQMAALDLPAIIGWVKRETTGPGAKNLQQILRFTGNEVLRVTGGQLTVMKGRASLVFGQTFMGGYGGTHSQVYTGQVRSFDITDTGSSLSIDNVKQIPEKPNYDAYRRRDYNLLPIIDMVNGKSMDAAVAQAGVFTLTNGVWTVPVEIDRSGHPSMADPSAAGTFKQGMNNYNSAAVTLFDSNTGANHMLQFGGISYTYYSASKGFVQDSNIPFINNSTAVVRKEDGSYRQVLLGDASFPPLKDKSGARLHFGAESGLFLSVDTPLIGNGLVDLRALLNKYGSPEHTIGWIFGGIAADAPNDGNSTASNEVFAIKLGPKG